MSRFIFGFNLAMLLYSLFRWGANPLSPQAGSNGCATKDVESNKLKSNVGGPNMDEAQKEAKIARAEEKARKKASRAWYAKKRFIVPIALVVLIGLTNTLNSGNTDSTVSESTSSATDEGAAQTEETTAESETQDYGSETPGQKNARGSAESYLQFQAFSKLGLIDQLLFEDYSKEDAEYAVNILDVDWKEQAVKKAESYLETMAFSQKGLLEQLQYEKFTDEEAEYGVSNITVDWKEQAALKAKSYLDSQSFSRQGLIDQLLFEGFSQAEAEYGVSQNGY